MLRAGHVEVLAGVEGEDVVGLPSLELPLRHEKGGGVLEPGRAPCCHSLTTPCRVSTVSIACTRGHWWLCGVAPGSIRVNKQTHGPGVSMSTVKYIAESQAHTNHKEAQRHVTARTICT